MHKYKGRRCSPERAERIAIRGIQWLAQLGLALLIIASLGTIAGAPASDRPEDSPRRAHPVILDEAPGHAVPIFSGPKSLFLPLNPPSDSRNGRNEPKDGEVCADFDGPPDPGCPPCGPVARPARSGIRPPIGRTSQLRDARSPGRRGPARLRRKR